MTELEPIYIVSTEKPWCCRSCGKQIGVVFRRNNIRHLRIEHLGLQVVVSMGAEVTCPACQEMREWYPGQEALDELMARMGNRVIKL